MRNKTDQGITHTAEQQIVTRGQEAGVFISRGVPFGYQLVKREGKFVVEIDEPQAQIVRQLMAKFAAGQLRLIHRSQSVKA